MASAVPDWLPNMLQNESFLQYHSYYHVSEHKISRYLVDFFPQRDWTEIKLK